MKTLAVFISIAILFVAGPSLAVTCAWKTVSGNSTAPRTIKPSESYKCTITANPTTTEPISRALCGPTTSYIVKPNDTATSIVVESSDDGGTTWTVMDESAIAAGENTEKNFAIVRRGQLIRATANGAASGTIIFDCGGY